MNPLDIPGQTAGQPAPAATTIDFADALCSHRPYLVRFASRRLRDAALVQDVVQETLLAALQAAARFEHKSALRTWLTAILLRQIAEHLRQSARQTVWGGATASDNPTDAAPAGDADDTSAASEPVDWLDPQRRLESRQFLEALSRSLAALPPLAARLFTLREIDGCSNAEAASELGISPRDCSVLLHRTRSNLRSQLVAA